MEGDRGVRQPGRATPGGPWRAGWNGLRRAASVLKTGLILAVIGATACASAGPSPTTSSATPVPSPVNVLPAPSPIGSAQASAASSPAASPASARSTASTGENLPHVTILYGTLTGAFAFVRMAADNGFLQQNGVAGDVEYVESATSIGALVSGQVQFILGGMPDMMQAVVGGAPLKMIAYNNPVNPYSIVSVADVKQVSDLKGKTVAIAKRGDTTEISLRMALQGTGIDVDKDINMLEVGNSPARWAALTSHQVDAAVEDQAVYGSQAQAQGLNILVNLNERHIPYTSGGVVVNDTWAKANPSTVLATLKGLIQAGRYYEDPQNRDASMAIIAQDLNASPDDPAVAQAYEAEHQLLPMGFPSRATAVSILQALQQIDPSRFSAMAPDQFIDASYMTTLRDQGFLQPDEAAES